MKIVNKEDLAVGDFKEMMLEKQPLPIGKTQFIEWSDRIIEGAHVDASRESLQFSLAAMLMHLGPTEAYREDAFFILQLRKAAVNQTAHAIMTEIKESQEKNKLAEDTANKLLGIVSGGVLENKEF
jgi:hypothetical protein